MDFGPKVMFEIFGIPITETVTTTWAIMAILILLSFFATRNLKNLSVKDIPDRKRGFAELVVEGSIWLVESSMGRDKIKFTPYMGTLALYLLLANLTGLVGLRQPTADLNTTLGLAILSFIAIHYYGAKTKGVFRYLKGFAEPIPFLAPLNLISEITTPISMAFRLFGNMVAGFIIMALVYQFVPVALAFLPVPAHLFFDLFAGVIQTFIFLMLTMTFITIAME